MATVVAETVVGTWTSVLAEAEAEGPARTMGVHVRFLMSFSILTTPSSLKFAGLTLRAASAHHSTATGHELRNS